MSTHCERVLELLSDGEPHSHHELYALFVVAHSRVSDLRKQGHRIEQWREGDTYFYRLIGALDANGGLPASPEVPLAAVRVERVVFPVGPDGQLVLA